MVLPLTTWAPPLKSPLPVRPRHLAWIVLTIPPDIDTVPMSTTSRPFPAVFDVA
jgi:hypothetical protein